MGDIVAFLNDRLADDAEEIAKHPDGEDDWPSYCLVATRESSYPCFPYLQIHKQRALAEVEAKRLQLGLHKECNESCYVVRILALPYASHSAYQEGWRL